MPVPADYRELPSAALHVRGAEALWSFQASSPGDHVVLPDARMDLVVRFRVNGQGRVTGAEIAIVGPSQRRALVAVEAGDRFLGLRYRAGWGGACLGVDPASLRDAALHGAPALDLLGEAAVPLRRAVSPDDVRDALVATARRRALAVGGSICLPVVKAIDLLHLTDGRLAVPDLARAVDLPERSLRRHVAASVGLSPKALAGVVRFQRTIRLLAGGPAPRLTLAQAALEGGYSDQAHMAREFRRHGGFTPGKRPPVAFGSLPIGGLAEICNTEGPAPA